MNEREFTRRFPNASRATVAANARLSDPEPERDAESALERADEGEKESLGRIVVRVTGYRVRPLDPDNFAGGLKALLDGVRHSHLVPDDNFWAIKLETSQVKVAHFSKERTDIEIVWPETFTAATVGIQ